MCPTCRQPQATCACAAAARTALRGDGRVRVRLEKAGRGGKAVTVVRGLALDDEAIGQLGKQIRAACGSGGTAKDGVVEIQGDHVAKVVAWLQARGRTVKRAGG